MKRFIFLFLLLSLVFSLIYCRETSYYVRSGWDLGMELSYFETVYYEHYKEKIEELKELYGIEVETLEERYGEDQDLLFLYLYNTEYTVQIRFRNMENYNIRLYYYDDGNERTEDYDERINIVNFINDFTNYVAFDTVTEENHFERLYKDALETGGGASNIYFEDSLYGAVGYYVAMDSVHGEGYYMMQKNYDLGILCTEFCFNGVLKPLDIDGDGEFE